MNNDKIKNSKKLAEYYVNFYKNNEDEVFKKIAQENEGKTVVE